MNDERGRMNDLTLETPETRTSEGVDQPVRPRAFVVGLIFAVAICLVTPVNNAFHQGTPLGGGHFPLAPFFIVAWLTVLVGILAHFSGKRAYLTGKELLVVWILMVLVSGIAYTGLVRTFFINLTAPFRFATPENRWGDILEPLLPLAWYPGDPKAVADLYDGLAGGRGMGWFAVFSHIPWIVWIKPLGVWTVFILLCYFVMLCLVGLFGPQWIDKERMNFPLLQVPRIMSQALDEGDLSDFLGNRFLLAGLAVPLCLHLLNGLNFYFPAVPQIPTLILAGPYFPEQGFFSGFHKLKMFFYPAFIGFAFLTTRQISFSFWFFFLTGGLLFGFLGMMGYRVPAADLGVTFGPTLARPEETQMIGAYLVFFLFLVWLARDHLRYVVRQAFTGRSDVDHTAGIWFSARFSFWGTAIGSLCIVLWLVYFGMSVSASFLLSGFFFIFMIVASRVICQGGVAYFTLTAAPLDGLLAFWGSGLFSHAGILMAGVVQKVLFVDLRESLLPSLLHAGKVSRGFGRQAPMLRAIVIALILGVGVSFAAMLTVCYRYGIRELHMDWATRTTVAVYDNIQTLIEFQTQSGHWVMVFVIAGAVVMLALVFCYHRFYWWPIHPIGYLVAYSSAMRILWLSFFLGWLCNVLCMRYGGIIFFRKMRYFFVGLIVGDFLMGGIWAAIGLFGDASYLVLPD